MPAVFAYLRVSTDAQDVENQKHGVRDYCLKNGWLPSFVEDTSSGKTPWQKRPLGQLLQQMQAGDVLVVSEVSRLARSVVQVLEIAKEATDRDIRIHVVKSGIVFDGSMQAKIVATMLGLAAELERDFISSRTKEALSKRKAEGIRLGRPPVKSDKRKLDNRTEEIDSMLRENLSKAEITRRLGCSYQTLTDWLKLRRPDGKPARKKAAPATKPAKR